MQVFGNVATAPERKESKSTGKGYYQLRVCESQRGVDKDPTWYTVRVMKDEDPLLDKGDFIKVTGKLKADFYIGRDGKPTGALLIIAFEASKIAKPAASKEQSPTRAPGLAKTEQKGRPSTPERTGERVPQRPMEPVRVSVQQEETNWSTMYD